VSDQESPLSFAVSPKQINQAIEYFKYRYALTLEAKGQVLADYFVAKLYAKNQKIATRKQTFEALKLLVEWAAYSRFHTSNPAMVELQSLREVYGESPELRVLDLAADLTVALRHLEAHLGITSPLLQELLALPAAPDVTAANGVPLFDLELDSFWEFKSLQRDPEPKLDLVDSTPLDVFFEDRPHSAPPAVEPSEEPKTDPTPAETPVGTFAKVYKLPKKNTPPQVLELMLGDDN
jgi:hypothetical protein